MLISELFSHLKTWFHGMVKKHPRNSLGVFELSLELGVKRWISCYKKVRLINKIMKVVSQIVYCSILYVLYNKVTILKSHPAPFNLNYNLKSKHFMIVVI